MTLLEDLDIDDLEATHKDIKKGKNGYSNSKTWSKTESYSGNDEDRDHEILTFQSTEEPINTVIDLTKEKEVKMEVPKIALQAVNDVKTNI